MKKSQKIIYYLSIIGLLVSLAFLCLGIKGISGVHQASEYTDEGVYTFVPYHVSAITVENTSTGRDKRIHPTKTIYAVYYHTLEKSVYQWKVETGNRNTLNAPVVTARLMRIESYKPKNR